MNTTEEQLAFNFTEEKVMTKKSKLTKSQVKGIKQLAKQGLSRVQIAKTTGHHYHQVIYCLLKSGHRAKKLKVPTITPPPLATDKDYKKLYFKAVSVLVEHGLIEVNL